MLAAAPPDTTLPPSPTPPGGASAQRPPQAPTPPDRPRSPDTPGPPVPPDRPRGTGGGSDPHVRLATFATPWEAELARGLLEQAGIPARVETGAAFDPYPSLAAVGAGGLEMFVPRSYLDEARRLLAEAHRAPESG